MTILDMAKALHQESAPRVGQIYLNMKRGNCLRINRIGNASIAKIGGGIESVSMAYCTSFRPDGAKGSQAVSIRAENLRNGYQIVTSIKIETPFGILDRHFITGEMQWKGRA